jgi:hypothetical protein
MLSCHCHKDVWESWCINPHILTSAQVWGEWSASYCGKESLVPIGWEAGWDAELLWTMWRWEMSCLCQNSELQFFGHLACSQSLYQLHYPTKHNTCHFIRSLCFATSKKVNKTNRENWEQWKINWIVDAEYSHHCENKFITFPHIRDIFLQIVPVGLLNW